ncbi:MAG: hypothetical protein ACQKBY_09230 [Verrucomicrobiales bacterium]
MNQLQESSDRFEFALSIGAEAGAALGSARELCRGEPSQGRVRSLVVVFLPVLFAQNYRFLHAAVNFHVEKNDVEAGVQVFDVGVPPVAAGLDEAGLDPAP